MFGVICIFILFLVLIYELNDVMSEQNRVSVDDLVTQSLIITIFELMFAIVFYITASCYF